MVKHELRVTSFEIRVKTLKHELKFKSASLNTRVTSSDPRITKSIKTQVNSLIKSSSFPKILSPKFFGNS